MPQMESHGYRLKSVFISCVLVTLTDLEGIIVMEFLSLNALVLQSAICMIHQFIGDP